MNTCICCNFTGSLVRVCAGCQSAFYCGKACQTRDWHARHQHECHLLKEICDIGESIAAAASSDSANCLIEGPVKRLADTSPTRLERDTRRQQQEQEARPPIYQLNKDVMRLIALLVRLDGTSLKQTSRAFRALYQNIDWKTQLMMRWDAEPNEFAKPIGRWLQDYRVYMLFPEIGLPERALTRAQEEQLEAIEAVRVARRADEDEPLPQPDLDEQVAAVEREAFRDRFAKLVRMADPVQQGIVNLFMMYYMYEENSVTHEGYCPADDGNEGNSSDDENEDEQSNFGPMRKITANLDIRPYRKITAPVPAFFPVEMLTAPLFDDYILGGAGYTGPRPDSVLAMALASDVIRPIQEARRGLIDHSVSLAFVKNFPKALIKCRSIIADLVVTDCSQFSDASMKNVAKMTHMNQARFYIHEEWERFLIDLYSTLPLLTGLYIGVQQSACQLREIAVSPSVMRESALTAGLYGACAPLGRLTEIVLSKAPTYEGIESFEPESNPYRFRVLPPGPYAGLSYSEYTRRILLEAFSKDELYLHARLIESLEKAGLMLSSPEQYKGSNFVLSFVNAVVASGISPLDTGESDVALPFRFWFYKGLPLYMDGREISYGEGAVEKTCRLSAEKRRGQGAVPLLEEMAEALTGWRVSVRNLKVIKKLGYDRPKRVYAEYVFGRPPYYWVDGGSPTRTWKVASFTSDNLPLEMPYELVNRLISEEFAKSAAGADFLQLTLTGFSGTLPAWLWLAPKQLSQLLCVKTARFGLPMQLMYHPGLRSLSVRGTLFGEFNWEMVHVAPEGRPGQARNGQPDTFMHQYFHDFERLYIQAESATVDCFPPLDLTTYNVWIYLELDASKPLPF